MTDRELRRLSRADLIDIVYELRVSEQALREENDALRQQLADSERRLSAAESLTEVSAGLNDLLASAERYIDRLRGERPPRYTVRAMARLREDGVE